MDVKNGLDSTSSAAIARVVEWAANEALYKVNAMHPGVKGERREDGPPMPGGHPCQRPWPPPREEYEEDFISCVNRFLPSAAFGCVLGICDQRLCIVCRFMYHDCSPYCRKKKMDEQGNQYETCRFYFPKECTEDYMLVVESGRSVVSMAVPRNHARIGAFVSVAVQGWKARLYYRVRPNQQH